MDNSGDEPGFQGFKLFGTMISMKDVQVKESAKEGDPPEKKLEKALPCPRCKSLETKFCYFNNYSVNQPRHFCKGCQRYWTAGGTLRNIPFGAGRRRMRSPSHGLTSFSTHFVLDPPEASELCLEEVLQQWHVSTSLSSKRPNNNSSGQICQFPSFLAL